MRGNAEKIGARHLSYPLNVSSSINGHRFRFAVRMDATKILQMSRFSAIKRQEIRIESEWFGGHPEPCMPDTDSEVNYCGLALLAAMAF
jgi:hypothetical protein